MKFSKKNKFIIFSSLVILNIVFRIPAIPHELGVDSFLMHTYANWISIRGFANWLIHPLSIFGLYPESNPAVLPFLLSGFSTSTGIDMEYTIMLVSIFIGLIGLFSSHVMSKAIYDDDLFAFLVAFIFSLSPIFLSYTIWTASTRNIFMAFTPLFVWGLMRCYNKSVGKLKYIVLTSILFISIAAMHRMFIILGFLLIAYIIALILNYLEIQIRINVSNKSINLMLFIPIIWFILYILFIVLQVNRLSFYENFNIWYKYQGGFFARGLEATSLLTNLIVDYWSKVGILSILGLYGLLLFLSQSRKELIHNFTLISLLLFAPIITMGWYVPLVLLPLFSILFVYGFMNFMNLKSIKKFVAYSIIIFIIISIIFSGFMMYNWKIWNKESDYFESIRNSGNFVKNFGNEAIISNGVDIEVAAISAIPSLRTYTEFDLKNKSDMVIKLNTYLALLSSGPENTYIGVNFNNSHVDFAQLVGQSSVKGDKAQELIRYYHLRYFIESNNVYGTYGGKQMSFFSDIHQNSPKIYDNKMESIWFLG